MKRIQALWLGILLFAPALGAGCGQSVEGYLEDLASDDPEDRMDAALALADTPSPRVGEALSDRLVKDTSTLVRASCARSLASFEREAVAAPLLGALKDREALVREEAVRSLASVGEREAAGETAVLLLEDESADVRRECAEALGVLGAVDRLGALIDALSDRAAPVRLQARLSLRSLTCRDFGEYAEDWRAWHEDFKKRMGEGGA